MGVGALCALPIAAGCGGDDDTADEPAATTAPATESTEAPETTTAATDASETTASDQMEPVEVRMVDISFEPAEITIPVGATVIWTNDDAVEHTATADDGAWDSGVLAPGDSFEFTFDEPGTYPYLCTIHPTQMQGTVVVES